MDQLEPLLTVLQSLWPLAGSGSQARQGGCNSNPLEVFGFLAFGLYLLNLAMGMRRRRKRREAEDVCSPEFDPQTNPELMQAVLAFTSMFGGFLSILNETEGNIKLLITFTRMIKMHFIEGEECKKLSLCRATKNAKRHETVGTVIAKAAGVNIIQRSGMESLVEATETGLKSEDCETKYRCFNNKT